MCQVFHNIHESMSRKLQVRNLQTESKVLYPPMPNVHPQEIAGLIKGLLTIGFP